MGKHALDRTKNARRISAPILVLLAFASMFVASAPPAPGIPICTLPACSITRSYYGPKIIPSPTQNEVSLCSVAYLEATGGCLADLKGLLYLPGRTSIAGSKPNLPL